MPRKEDAAAGGFVKTIFFSLGSVLFTFLTGCASTATGKAGAGISYSELGAVAEIRIDAAKLEDSSEKVFQRYGIENIQSEANDRNRSIAGITGDQDSNVRVAILSEGSSSKINVTATNGPVYWNHDYARDMLLEILAQSR